MKGPSGAVPGARWAEAALRLDAAVTRLETALGGRAARRSAAGSACDPISAERDLLARDCEHLRIECDTLRRALDACERHRARLGDAAGAVDRRLALALDELHDTLGG